MHVKASQGKNNNVLHFNLLFIDQTQQHIFEKHSQQAMNNGLFITMGSEIVARVNEMSSC